MAMQMADFAEEWLKTKMAVQFSGPFGEQQRSIILAFCGAMLDNKIVSHRYHGGAGATSLAIGLSLWAAATGGAKCVGIICRSTKAARTIRICISDAWEKLTGYSQPPPIAVRELGNIKGMYAERVFGPQNARRIEVIRPSLVVVDACASEIEKRSEMAANRLVSHVNAVKSVGDCQSPAGVLVLWGGDGSRNLAADIFERNI